MKRRQVIVARPFEEFVRQLDADALRGSERGRHPRSPENGDAVEHWKPAVISKFEILPLFSMGSFFPCYLMGE